MGYYTHDELDDFVKATWIGTYENQRVVKVLAGISILECKPEESQVPVRNRTGHLGGHRTTIRVGAKECHCGYGTPYLRTLALSRHFLVLYYRFHENLEKTCRVWNQGPKWKNDNATKYWNGVLAFNKIYDSRSTPNGE